jgi:hypothetical protein
VTQALVRDREDLPRALAQRARNLQRGKVGLVHGCMLVSGPDGSSPSTAEMVAGVDDDLGCARETGCVRDAPRGAAHRRSGWSPRWLVAIDFDAPTVAYRGV